MKKLLGILLILAASAAPATAQAFTNSTKLRGQAICNPLSPSTDGQALAWNSTLRCWGPTSATTSYANGYTYRQTITVNSGALAGSTLTDFPLTFTETDANFKPVSAGGKVQATCAQATVTITVPCDFIFTSDALGATLLNWEVEKYTSSSGLIVAHVRVPTASEGGVIYLFYGAAGVTTWQGGTITGVWDSSYKLVLHLGNGTTLSGRDSTTHGDDGTVSGVSGAAGKIDGAAIFAGSGSITGSDVGFPSGSTARTLEMWLYTDYAPGTGIVDVFEYGTRDFDKWFGFGIDGRGASICYVKYAFSNYGGSACSSSTAPLAGWHHIALVYTGGTSFSFYIDGALDRTETLDSGAVNTVLRGAWRINDHPDDNNDINGGVDELRLSTGARAAAWITASYNSGNHSLYTLSSGTSGSGGSGGSGAIAPGSRNESYASALTAAFPDTDLSLSTANGTDYTASINNYLAGASATRPLKLIVDGGLTGGPWIIPAAGNVTIQGLGTGQTGFYTAVGTNDHAIRTAGLTGSTDPGAPAPSYAGGDVTIRDLFLNGNGHGGASSGAGYNERGKISPQVWFMGIALANLQRVTLTNLRFYDPPTYAIFLRNTQFIDVNGVTCTAYDPSRVNHDCVHLDGPFKVAHIRNINCLIGDDCVALNSDEGNHTAGAQVVISGIHSYPGGGNIGSLSFLRLHGDGAAVSSVAMTQITGAVTWAAVVFGADETAGADAVTHFQGSDWQVSPSVSMMLMSTNVGDVSLNNVTWESPIAGGGNSVAWLQSTSARTMSSLTLNGAKVYRDGNGSASPVLVKLQSSAKLTKLVINGFQVADTDGSAYSAVPCLINQNSGTIGEIVIDALDTTNITALVCTNFTGISKISGAGVLATGWSFPDAVMVNGVPYYSSDQTAVCIKTGGTHGGTNGTVKVFTFN